VYPVHLVYVYYKDGRQIRLRQGGGGAAGPTVSPRAANAALLVPAPVRGDGPPVAILKCLIQARLSERGSFGSRGTEGTNERSLF
jgi:hypothetical protein